MSLRVFWSDRLEELADKMLDEWIDRPVGGNPFERTCVAVGDMATRNWLKDRFLLHRAAGTRRILANIDFKPLPELVNDWLSAAVHGTALRDPADHPFAKGVMAWRIDAILREKAGDPEFKTLAGYIAAGGNGAKDRRRFDLATRLAQMFDDYLVSRHAMLAGWEHGKNPSERDERWQALLYRELVRNAGSYAADYAKALGPGIAASAAFAGGFPRYAAIHVFDVPDAPWPYLEMLNKLSDEIPVTFWTFNPSRDFWMEDRTKKQLLQEKANRLRKALASGEAPDEEPENPDFSTAGSRLLGALATGARGLLANELDLSEGAPDWLGNESGEDFATLRSAATATEIHVCHSPRRELEAARDALHRFFAENKDAKFSDALVLCADWQKYSPLLEAVFTGSDAAGGDGVTLPVATAGMSSSTPITFSFGELLDFRTNRFEVSKVFALLGVPEIRDKFGIDTNGLSTLRDMVGKDNIHWGYDDADVRGILETDGDDKVGCSHFTWRRGLDRLTLDALLGPREDEDALYDAGEIGRLLPNGDVESERATLVGGLDRLVKRLAELRKFLKAPHTVEEWRDGLLKAIDDFYEARDASLGEVLGLRKAVDAVAAAAVRAREVDGRLAEEVIPGEVFCKAAAEAVKDVMRKLFSVGDAVRIAPLANGSAVPARFVWICGLNDGTFPRNGYRPTFDLIGRHPTMFDVTPRERDAMALLKAALGARRKLCMSYVGRDIRTNAEIPPAVPLTDLLEWFRDEEIHFAEYHHPLQAYSEKYFLGESDLPPCYSATNHDAAEALAKMRKDGMEDDKELPMVVPFPINKKGETSIDLDELAEFCRSPNRFLASHRLGLHVDNPKNDRFDDDDGLDAKLPREWENSILIRGRDGAGCRQEEIEALLETSSSLSTDEVNKLIEKRDEETEPNRGRHIVYRGRDADAFSCPDKTATQALAAWQDDALATPIHVDFVIAGHRVSVTGACRTVSLNMNDGSQLEYTFFFSPYPAIYDSTMTEAWLRHVAGHAAGKRFVTAMMCTEDEPLRTFRPLDGDTAAQLLHSIVEEATKPMACDIMKAADLAKDTFASSEWTVALGDFTANIVSTYGR